MNTSDSSQPFSQTLREAAKQLALANLRLETQIKAAIETDDHWPLVLNALGAHCDMDHAFRLAARSTPKTLFEWVSSGGSLSEFEEAP